jgi:hypothetical protein
MMHPLERSRSEAEVGRGGDSSEAEAEVGRGGVLLPRPRPGVGRGGAPCCARGRTQERS